MIVEVYRNLRHGCKAKPLYSIRRKGRVIARRHRVLLSTVTFVVSESGRQRVLRTGHKNVHAFVRGHLVDSKGVFGIDANTHKDLPVRVVYNPYRSGQFEAVGPTSYGVKTARAVLLNERGMSACYLETV